MHLSDDYGAERRFTYVLTIRTSSIGVAALFLVIFLILERARRGCFKGHDTSTNILKLDAEVNEEISVSNFSR